MLLEKLDHLQTMLNMWETNYGEDGSDPEAAYKRIKGDPHHAILTLRVLASRAAVLATEIQFEFGTPTT